MKITKETLIKMIKEQLNEMSSHWRQPGNAPPGTFKKAPKRYPRPELEPMPETTPEEDEEARVSFMQRVQINLIKGMVQKNGPESVNLTQQVVDALSVNDEGLALMDRIEKAQGQKYENY